MAQTTGEYRVGIALNPSGDDLVAQIKRGAADLIGIIETISPFKDAAMTEADAIRWSEINRLKALAQAEVESAAMWAVKAATKPKLEA